MAGKTYKSGSGRSGYPSDVSDEEWAFCAPYLTLMKEEAPQREHSMRAVFNALRYMVRAMSLENDSQRYGTVAHCSSADSALDQGGVL